MDAATGIDPWTEVVGQERAVAQLQAAARQPVHAYLLVGQEGWGALPLARAFAADVLAAGMEGAEADRVRRLAGEGAHADLLMVEAEGTTLRIDEVQELLRLAHRQPTERPRKVLLVPGFDRAGPRAWSQLLKVLEEPPPSTIWVLLADAVPVEMVTIASRSVVVRLDPVPPALVAARLEAEGHPAEAAAAAAEATSGDLRLARLIVGDERLALRVAAWRRVPDELDGTGHAVWRLVGELRAAIDDALAHLEGEFAVAEKELAAQVEELKLPKGRVKALAESHKRQLRRLRAAELRVGLAALAGRYRDALAAGPPSVPPARVTAAVAAIDATYEALTVRNANEALQLQALLAALPRL